MKKAFWEILLCCLLLLGAASTALASELVLPKNLNEIEAEAFRNDDAITKVILPDSLQTIGDYSFADCANLYSIYIPASVTQIGENAFAGNSSMLIFGVKNSPAQEYAKRKSIPFFPIEKENLKDWDACGKEAAWTLDRDGLLTVSGKGTMRFYSPYAADNPLERIYSAVKRIVINDGITEVSNYAFYEFDALEEIVCAGSVKRIGGGAFSHCHNLVSVKFEVGLETISSYAFTGCEKLENIYIPYTVTEIGYDVFCDSLTATLHISANSYAHTWAQEHGISYSVLVSEGALGENQTWSLYSDGLLTIAGSGAIPVYSSASENPLRSISGQVKRLELESGVTGISARFFSGWASLTEALLPETVKTIGTEAFYECKQLQRVTLSEGLETIGMSAFEGCSALLEIVIPESVTRIGNSAFFDCASLAKVTLPNSLTSIGEYAFSDCSSLPEIVIPDHVTNIGYCAFSSCASLMEITIPASVAKIGTFAFEDCTSVVRYEVALENQNYTSYNGMLFNKDMTTLLYYPCGNPADHCQVPDGVTSIFNFAFNGCASLRRIDLPYSLTSISDFAFSKCTGLQSIEIPYGVTKINYNVFSECVSLADVTLPVTVNSIDMDAFSCDETRLVTLTLHGAAGYYAQTWAEENGFAFAPMVQILAKGAYGDHITWTLDSEGLLTVSGEGDISVISSEENPLQSIYNQIKTVVFTEGITSIPESMFLQCASLEEVTIPDTVTAIGNSAFSGCASLKTVTIPGSVKKLGYFMFGNCDSLTSAVLEEGVEKIDTYAFYSCDRLEEVYIPLSATKLDPDAFDFCPALTIYSHWNAYAKPFAEEFGLNYCPATSGSVISEGNFGSVSWTLDSEGLLILSGSGAMQENGLSPFSYDSRIRYAYIKNGITTVASGAFEGCFNLEGITIPAGVTFIGANAFDDCASLQSVSLPSSVRTIGDSAFEECSSMTEIILREGLTDIGDSAFMDCVSLVDVSLPGSLTGIGSFAFQGCANVEGFTVAFSNQAFISENGVLLSRDKETLLYYPAAKADAAYEVPATVTDIESAAFTNCRALKEVTVSRTVETIQENAFFTCHSLTMLGYQGSAAQKYAFENDIPFKPCDTDPEEVIEGLPEAISYMVADYVDNNGYFPNEESTLAEAVGKVYDYTLALKDAGLIQNCVYNDSGNTVTIYDQSGQVSVFIPRIKDVYSANDQYSVVGITTFSPFVDMINTAFDQLSRFKVTGAVEAAKYVRENSSEFAASITNSWDANTVDDIIDCLNKIMNYNVRVIFWRGHGNTWDDNGTTGFFFETTEHWDDDKYNYLKSDNSVIPGFDNFGNKYFLLTEYFFQRYIPNVDGGLFCTSACWSNSEKTGHRMANLILSRGFDAYVGAKTKLQINHGDKLLGHLAECLLEKDEDGNYVTINQAYEKAVNDLSMNFIVDAYVGGTALTTRTDRPAFRLVPYRPAPEITFDPNGGTMSQTSVKLKANQAIGTLPVPTQSGYDFGGWNTEADGTGETVTEDYVPQENMTLYAMWAKVSDFTFKYQSYTDSYVLTGYSGNDKVVIIPAFYQGKKVTEIKDVAFNNITTITNVLIPKSVVDIGWNAFKNCTSLVSVNIPNSVTSIGHCAFEGCTSLVSVNIPNSVTSIGSCAFEGCTSLQNIIIPNSVEHIVASAFKGCTSLTEMIIPNSVSSIENEVFYGCTSLTKVTLPDSITSIGKFSFSNCISLSKISIPYGVNSIGTQAFSYCTSLSNITIPGSVTDFGGAVFYECTSLTLVTINNGVLNIGTNAFGQCTSLTSVTIPGSVTTIGAHAFYACNNLVNVTIQNGITSIDQEAFCGCGFPYITIPGSVTYIGDGAFSYCKNLISITIPSTKLSSMGKNIFDYSKNLQKLYTGKSSSIAAYTTYYYPKVQILYLTQETPELILSPAVQLEKQVSSNRTTLPVTLMVKPPVTSDGDMVMYATNPYILLDLPDCVTLVEADEQHPLYQESGVNRGVYVPELSGKSGIAQITLTLEYDRAKDPSGSDTQRISLTAGCNEGYSAAYNNAPVTFSSSALTCEFDYSRIPDDEGETSASLRLIQLGETYTGRFSWNHTASQSLTVSPVVGADGMVQFDMTMKPSEKQLRQIARKEEVKDDYFGLTLNISTDKDGDYKYWARFTATPYTTNQQSFPVYLANHIIECSRLERDLEYFTSPGTGLKQPYHIIVNSLLQDNDFNAAVGAWKLLTISPSTGVEIAEDELNYYRAYVFNVLYGNEDKPDFVKSAEEANKLFQTINDYLQPVSAWANVATTSRKICKENKKLIADELKNAARTVKNMEAAGQLASENKWLVKHMDTLLDLPEDISDLFDDIDTFTKLLERITQISALKEFSNEKRALLENMSQQAGINPALKQVIAEYVECFPYVDNTVIGIYITGEETIIYVMKKLQNELVADIISKASLESQLGLAQVFAAQQEGKLISNILFHTDGIIDAYFECEAGMAFEKLLADGLIRARNAFQANPTEKTAAYFVEAVEMFYQNRVKCLDAVDSLLQEALVNNAAQDFMDSVSSGVNSILGRTGKTRAKYSEVSPYIENARKDASTFMEAETLAAASAYYDCVSMYKVQDTFTKK